MVATYDIAAAERLVRGRQIRFTGLLRRISRRQPGVPTVVTLTAGRVISLKP